MAKPLGLSDGTYGHVAEQVILRWLRWKWLWRSNTIEKSLKDSGWMTSSTQLIVKT